MSTCNRRLCSAVGPAELARPRPSRGGNHLFPRHLWLHPSYWARDSTKETPAPPLLSWPWGCERLQGMGGGGGGRGEPVPWPRPLSTKLTHTLEKYFWNVFFLDVLVNFPTNPLFNCASTPPTPPQPGHDPSKVIQLGIKLQSPGLLPSLRWQALQKNETEGFFIWDSAYRTLR